MGFKPANGQCIPLSSAYQQFLQQLITKKHAFNAALDTHTFWQVTRSLRDRAYLFSIGNWFIRYNIEGGTQTGFNLLMPQHFDCRPEILFCTFALECSNEIQSQRRENCINIYQVEWLMKCCLSRRQRQPVAKNPWKMLNDIVIAVTKTKDCWHQYNHQPNKRKLRPRKNCLKSETEILDYLSQQILQLRNIYN